MEIFILNSILYTAQNNIIPQVDSIKDCLMYNVALGFKSLGHNVTLIASEDYKPEKNEEYDVNVLFMRSVLKRIFLPSVLPLSLKTWHFLQKNRKKVDLIISSEVFAFPSLFAALIIPKKTIVWHELALHQRKMQGIPSHFWYNIIAKLCFRKTLIVSRSQDAKKFIEKYTSRVSDAIVEHGINLAKFEFSYAKRQQFIVIAQLIPRKNIDSILKKFARFVSKKEFADYKLIIAGRGELENELKRQAIELNINDNVDFVGFKMHEELNQLISESQALLINTKQDNNMVSIPESVVSGTPVITNSVPTNAYVIKGNKLGIVGDWDETDLEEIVNNNNYYTNNCILFRDNFSILNTAKQLINAFEN